MCPKCKHEKDIDVGFGYRMSKARNIIAQSYCKSCRSSKNRNVLPFGPLVEDVELDEVVEVAARLFELPPEPPFDSMDWRTVLTTDLDLTRKIYAAKSSDKNAMKRSWKFCIQRLLKRYPEQFRLSPDAASRLGSTTTEGFDKLYDEA